MIHKTQKFNMKSERRAYREIYAFYFFCLFLKKVIKKLLTFCYWRSAKIPSDASKFPPPAYCFSQLKQGTYLTSAKKMEYSILSHIDTLP